jgi:hypothetical protein
MSTIVTRSGKQSPLTNTELDANFTNLNSDKLESGDLSVVTTAVGTAALAYNSGVFTYTPPDLSAIDLSLYAPLAGAVFTGNVEAPLFEGDLTGAILFKGSAGEALTKGDPVYISGISGNKTVVSKADANDASKMPCFGIVDDTVSLNADCSVVTFGTLQGLDTSSFSEGDELYISDTGTLTTTAPTGEASQIQKIAKVTRSHASAGSIKVMGAGRTNATPNLNDGNFFLGNSSNQAVSADFTTAVRGEISAGTGIGLSGGVISNTAPDQTVALTGAGTTSVSGTYPNFTITGAGTTYTAGSGLSLTGTEFANTAPDQTVALTAGGATSISGTYPNFTISSVNTTYSVGDGGLSQINFTSADHTKLNGIATGAEVNVQSNWNATGGDAFIANKPTIPTNNNQLTNGAGYVTANTTYTAGSGLSLTGTVFANTAPDQTVALTGAGATSISGTYPNFTITSANTTYSVGDGGLTQINFTGADHTKLNGIATGANNYSLPLATNTVRGGIELFSNTDQSVAANGITTTANRTYGIQLNSANQAVVNVPWSDTNTVYSLPLSSSSTRGGVKIGYSENGKNYPVELSSEKMFVNVPWSDSNTTYSAGTGISLSGTTFSLTDTNAKLNLSGGTMTGELQLNARLDIGSGTQNDAEIRIYKADNNVSDHIQFYNGTTRMGEIGCQDTSWLRINQVTAKNIYTPRYIRADGGFFVDGTAKGINGSGNFIGGTITGASDANVSNWNTAYGWGNHATAGYYPASNPNGYTNDQTAAEILTAVKTVDGSGSGLDADLLDGQHGSHYLNYNNLTNKPGIPPQSATPTVSISSNGRDVTITNYSSYINPTIVGTVGGVTSVWNEVSAGVFNTSSGGTGSTTFKAREAGFSESNASNAVNVTFNTKHRYWRLTNFTGGTSQANAGNFIYHINFYSDAAGTIKSANYSTRTASYYYSGYLPSNTQAANNAAWWSLSNAAANRSGTGTWLKLDNGSVPTVNAVCIRLDCNTTYMATACDLQWSDDNSTWTTWMNISGSDISNNNVVINL